MCIFKRGQTTHIHNSCFSPHLKSGDFIGAFLQAKVIGCHFVRLPLECILSSWICQILWNPFLFEQRNQWTCRFWQILEHWILWMALFQRIHPIPSWTILFCLLQQTQPMVTPSHFCQQHALCWKQWRHQKWIWRLCPQLFQRQISRTCKMVPTNAYPSTQRHKLHSWSTWLLHS